MPSVRDAVGPRRDRYERAVAEVYEPLQRYARRRIDSESAADVVADTLLVLWRRLDEVPDGRELPWCYGVARRQLANARRGEDRRLRLVDKLIAEPSPAEDVPSEDPRLAAALSALSETDRELISLWAWEQLEPREIARVTGMSANAVSIRLFRIRRRLRQQLERKNPAPSGHEAAGHRKEAS